METENKNFILKITLNGKKISLKENKAKQLIKLGIKAEKYKNAYDIFAFLAEREGITLDEFALNLKEKADNSLREKFSEKLNGDEELIEKLIAFENEKAKTRPKCDNGFSSIQKYFSEYKSAEDLPDEVILIAETDNISLYDALLRYNFSQQQKIKEQLEAENKNKKHSAGSLKDTQTDYGFAVFSAMLKGTRK